MNALRNTFASTDIQPFYVGSASATISLDGRFLATAVSEDIVITDLEENKVIHKLEGDGEDITSLQITPDGRYLAVVSQSQQLRVFDLEKANFVKSFKLSSPVYISAADPTSTLFSFGGSDGVVTVWDIEGGYVTHSLKGHGTTICSLSFFGELNSSNWKLASGDTMGTVKIWDLVKRKCTNTINEHNTAVRGVAFNSTGEYFMTGGRDQVAIIYNTKNFKVLRTISTQQQIENCGFLSLAEKEYFYTAGSGNVLKVFDVNSGKLVAESKRSLETNEELMIMDILKLETNSLFLVLTDQTLVEVDLDTEDLYDLDSKTELVEIPVIRRIAGNHGTIADIRYVGPELNLIALATNSPGLRVIDPTRPLELRLYEGHTDLLNALDTTIDGKWIATAGKDNEARLWRYDDESEDFQLYATFQGHAGSVTAIALPRTPIQSYPKFLITGSSDFTVKKWKVPKPESDLSPKTIKSSEYTRKAHDKDINSIDITPNDEFFATASYDKLGKIWDLETGETVGILKGHKRGLWDIKFCQYDKLIVTGSGDKTVKLWSLNDFTCTKTFEGHTNAIQRVRFFNKNHQLISTGADGLIKIWDIKSDGECLKTLDNHVNRIWAFDIKNDGEEFISADADGNLSLWVDNTDETLADEEAKRKIKVEQEQSLSNYINAQDWSNAFLLALTLDHPMRLYNVIKSSISYNEDPESTLGSLKLEETVSQLNDDQLLLLFKRIRDWNTNAKLFEISQKLINVAINKFSIARLSEIPGLMKLIDSIIPYSERHFTRLDDLIEQSFIIDYAISEMDKML